MSSTSVSTPSTSRSLEGWLLAGLVAVVVAAELLVSAAPALGASDTVRTALAALVLFVTPVVGVVGLARETLHPATLVVALPITALYAYTGLLLPWTQLSFRLGQVGIDLALSVPVVGGDLAGLLFGGNTLSQTALERALLLHRLTVAAGVALVAVGFGWSRTASTRTSPGDVQG